MQDNQPSRQMQSHCLVNCVYVLAYGASIDAKGIYVTGGRCLKPAIDTESMGVMTVTTCVRVGLQRRGWPS